MRFLVPAIVLSIFAVFTTASPVPQGPSLPPGFDPSQVYIEAVSYAGSGCKAGSVAISPSQDWTVVTLAFDSYIASIGPGISFVERRKNCNINFKLHYPQGLTFALYKTDYYGRVELQPNVRGTQEASYWFAGQTPPPVSVKYPWNGPKAENYHHTDTILGSALVWSPCGASTTLNVDTQVYLDNSLNPGGSGYITTDVIDHKVRTLLSIQWKKCP